MVKTKPAKPDRFTTTLRRLYKTASLASLEGLEFFFHVSPSRNRESIFQKGLVGKRLNDGTHWTRKGTDSAIFLLTDDCWVMDVLSHIQLVSGVKEFDVWEIDVAAIDPKTLKWDDAGELYASNAFYTTTPIIAPKFLNLARESIRYSSSAKVWA